MDAYVVCMLRLSEAQEVVGQGKKPKSYPTRIKDAGMAIRHSRGYIISILQGLEMGCKGLPTGLRGPKIKKKVSKTFKEAFCPKVKSSKLGLSITPRQFL